MTNNADESFAVEPRNGISAPPAEGTTDGAAHIELAPIWALIKRLPTYVRLSGSLARDPRVPGSAKAALALGGAYVISPIDLIPGIIPVAGQLDDLYVVLTGVQQAIRLSPDYVVDEHLTAVGLDRKAIDDDLASLRMFIRQGLAWTFQKGETVVSAASRQTRALMDRVRAWGNTHS